MSTSASAKAKTSSGKDIVDVTIDRHLWLGGSDMIKVFGTDTALYELAYDKAFPKDKFFSNKYTEYGHLMEPLIRAEMEEEFDTKFFEDSFFDEELRIRGNTDGYSLEINKLLECKTAVPHKSWDDCVKSYKYQMLTYSYLAGKIPVILAVLVNDDFKPVIDEESDLSFAEFTYQDLLDKCELTEELFIDNINYFWETVEEAKSKGQVVAVPGIDNQLVKYADYQQEIDLLKEKQQKIKDAIEKLMSKNDRKSYKSSIATISVIEPTTTSTFDSKKFQKDHTDLYNDYIKVSEKKGSINVRIKKEMVDA